MNAHAKILILTLCIFLSPLVGVIGDKQTIYLRNGQILRGDIISQTALAMRVKLEDGKIVDLTKKEIRRIGFHEPTPKELKEAEEKAKQAAAEPPPPEPTPKKEEPVAAADKPFTPASPFDLDRTNRKDLEIWAGIGTGTYAPATEYAWQKAIIPINLLFGDLPQQISKPDRDRKPAYSLSLIYHWRRFSFGVHSNHFQSTMAHHRTNSSDYMTNFDYYSGSFTEKQNILKGDISFLAYSKGSLDLSPSLGYMEVWGKTPQSNVQGFGVFEGQLIAAPSNLDSYSENNKGTSIGLKSVIRFRERWENRIELHSLNLSGNQISTLKYVDAIAGGLQYYTNSIINMQWNAKGYQVSYKLAYRYTPTISFWVGLQLLDWKYSIKSMNVQLEGPSMITSPPLPEDLFLQSKLIESAANSSHMSSRSTSLEIGAAYRIEFKK